MLRIIAAALAITIATPLAGHAQNAAEKADIDRALARGQLIYAYDQAAWHGTDAMLKKIEHPEKVIGGWIVDGPASAPTLIFFDQDQAEPHAAYIAEFRDNRMTAERVVAADSPERMLSAERRAMIAALEKGKKAWQDAKPLFCSKSSPNSVVLPPERPGGPHLVYIMTPQTENRAYPLGGHFRVEIGADGSVGASRGFTKSCITMPAEAGKEAAALFITHMLDPVPTEIHVFTARSAGVPVAVGTTSNDMMWWVTGDRIEGQKLKK